MLTVLNQELAEFRIIQNAAARVLGKDRNEGPHNTHPIYTPTYSGFFCQLEFM